MIELLLHIFCEEIKTQRLHDQHPSWIPADGLSSDLKRLLYAIEKINERSSNNSSHVISACAKVMTTIDTNMHYPVRSYTLVIHHINIPHLYVL